MSLSLRWRRQPQHLTHIRRSEQTPVYLWLMFVCVVLYSVDCVLFIFKQFRLSQFTSNSRFLLEPITLFLSGGRWSGAHCFGCLLLVRGSVVHVIARPFMFFISHCRRMSIVMIMGQSRPPLSSPVFTFCCSSDRRQMIADWIIVIWMHDVPHSRHSLFTQPAYGFWCYS